MFTNTALILGVVLLVLLISVIINRKQQLFNSSYDGVETHKDRLPPVIDDRSLWSLNDIEEAPEYKTEAVLLLSASMKERLRWLRSKNNHLDMLSDEEFVDALIITFMLDKVQLPLKEALDEKINKANFPAKRFLKDKVYNSNTPVLYKEKK
jgi:hypothetical protein